MTKEKNEEIPVPIRYEDVDVSSKIDPLPDADGNGTNDLGMEFSGGNPKAGDNHGGYIGFRSNDKATPFAGDGAMDVVVSHWRNNDCSGMQ